MSTQTTTVSNGSSLFVNTDTSKIFIRENRYERDSYVNNSGYDPITLKAGTIMGRISATGILVPWTSTASDGSQNVVGILADDMQIAGGATAAASICIYGDVAKEQLVFTKPGDAFETVVAGRRVFDKIKSETAGIRIITTDEMTNFDNPQS
jgi:hypothetical protein